MKIAICADIHARGKDLPALDAQLKAMTREVQKRGVSVLCIAGDVFDRASIGDSHASTGAIVKPMMDFVLELNGDGIDPIIIPGNHDYSGPSCRDALHVFDASSVLVPRGEDWNDWRKWSDRMGLTLITVPWMYEENAEAWITDRIRRAKEAFVNMPSILVGHIRVTGGRMNGNQTYDGTTGWTVSRAFLESLPVDHIALGDFHGRQELVPGKGGYVGALRQCNFGEEGNPAGFEIWDSETGVTEWVELDAAPKHRTVCCQPSNIVPPERRGNELLRVRYEGGIPAASEIKAFEDLGAVVEVMVPAQERLTRAAEDVSGALSDPHRLYDIWGDAQTPAPPHDQRLRQHAALSELLDGKAAA